MLLGWRCADEELEEPEFDRINADGGRGAYRVHVPIEEKLTQIDLVRRLTICSGDGISLMLGAGDSTGFGYNEETARSPAFVKLERMPLTFCFLRYLLTARWCMPVREAGRGGGSGAARLVEVILHERPAVRGGAKKNNATSTAIRITLWDGGDEWTAAGEDA